MRLTRGLVAVALVLPLAGCGLFSDDSGAQDAANKFLTTFAAGDDAGAAKLTDGGDSARRLMDSVRASLKPAKITTKLGQVDTADGGSSASATFTVTWDLGSGRLWTYDGHFDLAKNGDAWQVHWAPTVLHPQLGAQQTITLHDEQPEAAPVLDRDGKVLIEPMRVVSVVVDGKAAGDLNKVAGGLASVLKRFDKTITQKSIVDGVKKSGGHYQVISLRDNDYKSVKSRIYDLPGVVFPSSTRLLAVDKKLAPVLLGQIRALVDKQLTGQAGWRVTINNSTGTEVQELFSKPVQPAQAMTLTISTKYQKAAEAALAKQPQKGMIVAIQPSTGEVLAVAQNTKADKDGLPALSGRYPPGSTFKIITGSAALGSGMATANSKQPCPGKMTIGTREIPNNNEFDKGTIPLHEAFAVSCNTTFANLASKMPPNLLSDTALKFGLGVDYVMSGATTITGSVPPATDETERAEDGFGQGKVLASPFGMALVAATVESGKLPLPILVRDTRTTQNVPVQPVDPKVLAAMRSMMREVVTSGHGATMKDIPNSYGKTGTAQFGDGSHAHGWFVGYVGDMAFATLLVDSGTSGKAANAAALFVKAAKG
ncbi:penicillin-binding transpeptidase domain-containing protein [Labedaea rhizosphaerae]|uniref:Cell division protein FtsI/penicillin-binding protein 2 n=1 Tax=Labedaea rhizosphaerae TaxID=598644 RepID=A0A4R6SBL0_LABRH|nr:penicillin-binding transpeptidase domain-containing protein [Labedaea rhizosphaerae]TDP97342.1 cell division protein FtsI/penicillin-binding protein 2 [Labedaea rhizosphaerae]